MNHASSTRSLPLDLTELERNVFHDNGHRLHLLQLLLTPLHFLVLLEVLDILRVRQVLQLGVLVVVLLPVVNLILVFVVAVVAGAGADVGKGVATIHELLELEAADESVFVSVDELKDLLHDFVAASP